MISYINSDCGFPTYKLSQSQKRDCFPAGFYIYIYIEFIEINKHKKKLQIYIQQLMAAHIIVDNGYLKIE